MLPPTLLALALLPTADPTPLATADYAERHATLREWARRLRIEGEELRDAGKLNQALAAFDAALLLRPTSDYAHTGRGKTLTRLGRHDDAADAFARAIAIDPHDWANWVGVGEGWLLRERYDEAQKCFDRSADLAPPGPKRCDARLAEMAGWLGAGWVRDRSGRTNNARTRFTVGETAALPPVRASRAEFAVTRALAEGSDGSLVSRGKLFALRGMLRDGMGRAAGAIADLDEALKTIPDCADALHGRASLALRQSDGPLALRLIDRAEACGLDPVKVFDVRSDVYVNAHEWRKAADTLTEWCEFDPTDPYPHRWRAVALWKLGDDDAAMEEIVRTTRLAGTSVLAEVGYSMSVLPNGKRDLATVERILTRGLDHPNLGAVERGNLYKNRGRVRWEGGRVDEAFDDLTVAVRLMPDAPGARQTRAELALHTGRTAAAMEDSEAACRLDWSDPACWRLLRSVRGAEEMAAGLAGRTPDFRPAGPVVRVSITLSYSENVIETLQYLRGVTRLPAGSVR